MGVVFYESVKCTAAITVVKPCEFPTALAKIVDMCLPAYFLVSDNVNDNIVRHLSEYDNVTLIKKGCSYFSFKNGVDAINSLFFTVPEDEQEQMRRNVASGIIDVSSRSVVGAIGALITYITSDLEEQVTISLFKTLSIPHGLVISGQEMKDLQIFSTDMHPSIHNPLTSKEGLSLFSYMNRCGTAMGRSTLRDWFLLSNSNMGCISERLDVIEKLIDPSRRAFVDELIKKIHRIPEIRQIIVRLAKGAMQKSHWLRLHNASLQVASLCEHMHEQHAICDHAQFAVFDQRRAEILRRTAEQIDAEIDLEAPGKTVKVKDDNHPLLAELRKSYSEIDSAMTYTAKKIIEQLPVSCSVSSLTVVYIPQQGFMCAMNKSEQADVAQLPDDFRLQFETETHLYCKHTRTDELDRDIGDIYKDIINCEIKILVTLSNQILGFSHILHTIWDAIGVLDSFCALAIVAVEGNYTKPIISDKRDLKIIGGRHPVLERTVSNFVPNDTQILSKESTIHIITGPNSSGKSVYMKQVALIVYMAHIGSFVPAEFAEIPMIDRIYTLVHRQDETSRPFTSSFMTEMRTVAKITGTATGRSLVLMDEMGKTANHEDGASIFAGFIKYMSSKGETCPLILMNTHFHSVLKETFMKTGTEYVPCTMEIRLQENFMFLYKLVKGSNGGSYADFGLRCAAEAGMHKRIIERAKIIADCYETGSEIPPNPSCTDQEYEESVKRALALFFNWNGSNPRSLLTSIDATLLKH